MNPPGSDIVAYVVRMVIPLKREFGYNLDVGQFLHDLPYAQATIKKALESQDERLRQNAQYVQTKMFGPRTASEKLRAADPDVPVVKKPVPSAAPPTAQPAAGSEEEMRAKMMAKYKSGLR